MIQNLAGWFNSGGPFMWAILAVLAAACAVMLERAVFYYFFCGGNGLQLVARLAQAIGDDNTADAKKIISRGSSPLRKLLRKAVDLYSTGTSLPEIQEGVEEAAIQQVPRLSQRLNYLSLCANIATLLGLLGTISGLRLSFTSLASIEAAKKATMLASGISQAMITTAFGLIVAIPCMAVYTFLSNKQARLTRNLDEATVKFLNFLKKKQPR
ncbi:MAG: MotA/TolQ/ExbB proton channel family protein [Chitinispirillaceae bacterium]|nr:MotA/TolQ/ExbB proton channel family protein [Chitinispirillaceae bacterium]